MAETIVVTAFEGRRELWKTSHSSAGGFSAPDLTDAVRKKIDKLVFHDGDAIAFVVPVFAGSFQRTVAATKVTLEGTMRCHLIELGQNQSLALTIELISAGGAVKLRRFSAPTWEVEEPAVPAPLASVPIFLRQTNFSRALPPFALACGLKAPSSAQSYKPELRLSPASDGARRFRFTAAVPVSADTVTLFPGLNGEVSESSNRRSAMVVEQPIGSGKLAAADRRSDLWIASVGGVRVEPVVAAWNELVAKPVVAALDRVKASALSFLPRFVGNDLNQKFATVAYSLVDASTEARLETNDFTPTFAPAVAGKIAIVPRRFALDKEQELDWHFDGLRSTDGETIVWRGKVSTELQQLDTEVLARAFHWSLLPDRSASTKKMQLSGVELTLGKSTIDLERTALTGTYAGDVNKPILDADVALAFPIAGLLPEGQDPVPGEEFLNRIGSDDEERFRRPEAFTIDLIDTNGRDQKLLLKVEEAVARDRSHEVNLHLFRQTESKTDFDLVILDAAPLLVARVRADQLLGSASDTNEVAQWSSRPGASWQFAGAEAGFDLILPPQVLGETMERYRGDFEPEGDKLRPADFRFSPLTIARIAHAELEQRLAEPPWNLRRVLGYPGQRLPGASLTRLAFELLYGLAGRVRPRGVRITEIAARLGRPPAALLRALPWRHGAAQKSVFNAYRKKWTKIAIAVRSRLGVLELYRHGDKSPLALTEADGLVYHFRDKSDLRYPIAGVELPPGFTNGKLRGGWAWGFESANIVNAVWKSKHSGSALLERPFLSSLGGWGKTMGRFDEERSAIWGETAMGRTFSLTIERIGRIGVYWNRAKHVIVYERTVAPSAQFHDAQDPLLGVPVLRKVREYVEIFETRRSFGGEELRNRGFIEACSVPQDAPRIAVDSRWGTDIPTGWKVPLWQRNFNSPVYPKPQVTLEVAGERPGEVVPVTIDEPEKLYFYTNTLEGFGADTDRWPAVEGVDYASVAEVKPPEAEFGKGTPVRESPPDVRVPVGASTFTLALAPATQRVNVVAGRTAEAIGSALLNITVMRGPLTNAVPGLEAAIDDVVGKVERAAGDFQKAETYADAIARVHDAVKGIKLDAIADQIPDPAMLCEQLKGDLEKEFDRVTAQVRAELEAAFYAFTEIAATEAERVAELTLDVAKQRTKDAIAKGAAEAHRLVSLVAGAKGHLDEAIGEAKASATRMKAEIEARLKIVDSIVDEGGPWEARQARLEHACEVLARHADEAIAGVERAVEAVNKSIAAGRATTALLAIRKELITARQRILALRALVRDLGKSTQVQIKAAIKAIRDAADAAKKFVEVQLDAIQKLIDDNVKPADLDKEIDRIRDVLVLKVDAAPNAKDISAIVAKAIQDETKKLQEIIEKHIASIRTAIAAKVAAFCALLPTKDEVRKALEALASELKARLEEAFKDAIANGLTVDPNVFLAAIRDAAESLQRGLSEIVAPLERAIATSAEKVLQLIRALGEPPKLPDLGFDLPDLGYYFVRNPGSGLPPITLPNVNLTPVLAAFGRGLASAAEALSFKLPTISLSDRIDPFKLENFDLSKIFPDFSGLKLGGLFENLKLPAIANDKVRVTHGLDPQTRSGWVQLDIDVPYGSDAQPIFSILGLTLTIANARFIARSRIETTLGSPPRQNFQGEIVGDWALAAGGYKLVTLEQTRLRFDDHGNIRFEVSADKVKLDGVLQFLSDLISKFGYNDSGFSIGLMPTGIRSVLDLPLPDVQAGSFGLANLRLGCIFELDFGGDFQIRCRLFVARKVAPFTMTIFVLGGAGWLDVQFTYFPSTKVFRTEVSVGITAAASLAIALGPIKGGVYAYFGIVVEYRADSGTGASNLAIGLMLLFRGEVSLLGFLSVSLSLLLEAQYQSGGGLVGRGHVSYSIKICWCVTINVSASVEYRFGGGGGGGSFNETTIAKPTFLEAAKSYVAMFEEEA